MMKRFFSVLIALVIGGTACDRDENTEIDYSIDESIFEELYYERLLMNFSDLDTLESGEIRRVPRLGECLYSGCPDEFYLLADDSENAYSHFLDLMIPDGVEDRITMAGNEHVLVLNEAKISFHATNTDGRVAEIDVDIPEIPGLKRVFFMTEDSWPVNGEESPFELGQIWKYGDRCWICVKDSRQGTGRLLTTSNNGHDAWYKEYDYFQKGGVCVRTKCASMETWLAFKEFRRKYPQRFKENILALREMYHSSIYNMPSWMQGLLFCMQSMAIDDPYNQFSDKFQIGTASVKEKYAWIPAHYYYIVEYDYYYGSERNNEILHYKTSRKDEYPPSYVNWSEEFKFNSGDFDNHPELHGWELITNE